MATPAAGHVIALGDPGAWGSFAVLFSRFLTGDTVYQYIAGSGLRAAQLPADIMIAGLLIGLLAVGVLRLRAKPVRPATGIVSAGWQAWSLSSRWQGRRSSNRTTSGTVSAWRSRRRLRWRSCSVRSPGARRSCGVRSRLRLSWPCFR